jgi:AcrR family transcriptional regulator
MALEPTTARGRATRDRILQAATVLVKERGVALTTIDAVQEAAGVGRSQMYHYFDDREDLMRAVVSATVDAVLAHQDVLLKGSTAWQTSTAGSPKWSRTRGGRTVSAAVRSARSPASWPSTTT